MTAFVIKFGDAQGELREFPPVWDAIFFSYDLEAAWCRFNGPWWGKRRTLQFLMLRFPAFWGHLVAGELETRRDRAAD